MLHSHEYITIYSVQMQQKWTWEYRYQVGVPRSSYDCPFENSRDSYRCECQGSFHWINRWRMDAGCT